VREREREGSGKSVFPPNEKSDIIVPFCCTIELFDSFESIVPF